VTRIELQRSSSSATFVTSRSIAGSRSGIRNVAFDRRLSFGNFEDFGEIHFATFLIPVEAAAKRGASLCIRRDNASRKGDFMSIRAFFTAWLIAFAAAGVSHGSVGPVAIASCRGWGCTGIIASGSDHYFKSHRYNSNGSDSASLYRTTKSGGGEIPLYQVVDYRSGSYYLGKPVYVHSMLRDSVSYAYFVANREDSDVQSSRIKRVPLSGGSADDLGAAPEFIGVADFITDRSSRLFWADRFGIRSMAITGGAIQTLILFPNTAPWASQIAFQGGYVYYTFGQEIRRVPSGGGTSATVLTAPGDITDLYVHAPMGMTPVLYWGETGGAVRSVDAGGSVYTHQEPTGKRALSVGFDGTRVLWIECDPERYFCYVKAKTGSSQPVTVAYEDSPATNLVWDSTSMYWTNFANEGAIKKYIH
jgi:hypothetical protein